jgi:Domain of unknown function (DUF4126)
MNTLTVLSVAFGSAWASGLNLYAMAATLGLLGRFAGLPLPGQLGVLTNTWVLGIAIALYCIEFVADKVPIVDSVWDVIHTFLRVPAGAAVAAAAFGDYEPAVQAAAFLIGGGLALSSHGAKAAARAAINMSPEPVTNITASFIEDFAAIAMPVLAFVAPVLVLILLAIILVLTIWLAPKIIRLAGRTYSAAKKVISR